MKRLLATTVVLAAIIIPATALAEQGQNGPPGPEGNPNYNSTEPAESGASTAPPGNSGNNPHGGPGGPSGGSAQSTDTPSGGETVAPAATPPPTQQSSGSSTAAEPAPTGSGGGGPDGKITICHATGSETNPYVVITVSENATTGNGHGNGLAHQNDEDVIPAGSGGSCPSAAAEPPTVIEDEGEQGVLGQPDGGRPDRAAPSDAPAGPPAPTGEPKGQLPFTGMFLGALLIAGVVAMTGGVGLRRASREVANDGGAGGLSQRRDAVAVQASAWGDSIAARTTELGERIATLERSLSD